MRVVGAHHTLRIGRHMPPMAAVIAVAEEMAITLGFGDDAELELSGSLPEARELLGLDAARLPALRERARAAIPA